jgi:hypothetical protein
MKRGFVKAFLHIFSFVSLPSGIFCISVKTHEVGKVFLVKIAYMDTRTREKSPSFPGRAEIWYGWLAEWESSQNFTAKPLGKFLLGAEIHGRGIDLF